jgi:hypothetical protein
MRFTERANLLTYNTTVTMEAYNTLPSESFQNNDFVICSILETYYCERKFGSGIRRGHINWKTQNGPIEEDSAFQTQGAVERKSTKLQDTHDPYQGAAY